MELNKRTPRQSPPSAQGDDVDVSSGGESTFTALADSEQPKEDGNDDSSNSSSEGDKDGEEGAVSARRGSAHPAATGPASSLAAGTMGYTRPYLQRGSASERYIVGTLQEADEMDCPRAHVMEMTSGSPDYRQELTKVNPRSLHPDPSAESPEIQVVQPPFALPSLTSSNRAVHNNSSTSSLAQLQQKNGQQQL